MKNTWLKRREARQADNVSFKFQLINLTQICKVTIMPEFSDFGLVLRSFDPDFRAFASLGRIGSTGTDAFLDVAAKDVITGTWRFVQRHLLDRVSIYDIYYHPHHPFTELTITCTNSSQVKSKYFVFP